MVIKLGAKFKSLDPSFVFTLGRHIQSLVLGQGHLRTTLDLTYTSLLFTMLLSRRKVLSCLSPLSVLPPHIAGIFRYVPCPIHDT